jgi:Na+-translocating ferredoxin:NAD+ oxidoreductase RnfG subunit
MSMRAHWLIPTGALVGAFAQVAYATQYMSVEQAQHAAFPQALEFRAVVPPNASLAKSIGGAVGWSPKIWQARAADQIQGWLIVDQVRGKSELITYALALDAAGAVIWIEVLDYRESHGAEIRLPAWRHQFVGKTAKDAGALTRDIRNISGATLSCRHLTEGVQRLLKLYDVSLRPEKG